ncbi:hemopexin repeat-containing protein [Microbispora siamensis]
MHSDSNAWLPSYERLFGDLDLRAGDEARSVYSPAAYLTDLLNLLDDAFDDPALLRRRPDIAAIPLDAGNTFPPVPYLDIVVRILEGLVGPRPYETLATMRHPAGLPFSLEDARVATYLRHLGLDPVEVYRVFAGRLDPDRVARERLRLTSLDVEVVTTPRADDAGIAELYGRPLAELTDVEAFLAATALHGDELSVVLYGDPDQNDALERSPEDFFVHAGGPVVRVSDDGLTLVRADDPAAVVPAEWFDRVNRFVRLARRTGLAFPDLDLVLAACADGTLDGPALRLLAAAVDLREAYGVPFDVVATLATHRVPREAAALAPPFGDVLGPQNREYRLRLSVALDMAEADLVAVVQHFRDHYDGPLEESPFDRAIGSSALSLLVRVARLTGTLGMPVEDLFGLIAAVEADPALVRYSTFAALPVTEAGPGDCHRTLMGDDPQAALWLTQTLCAVNAWLTASGFAVAELGQVLGEPATAEDAEEELAVLTGIAGRFADLAFTPESLVSDRFDERSAQVVHDVLVAYDDGVVSPRDSRLLRADPARLADAAYAAVSDLPVLTKEDFQGIGLAPRVAAKIFANLVLYGLFESGGRLKVEDVPDDLLIAGFFDDLAPVLFDALAQAGEAFHPSGVAELLPDLDEVDQEELYDNLVYNGYLDEDGQIVDQEFFADPDNAELFTPSADLADLTPGVLGVVAAKIEDADAAALAFDPGVLADLRLPEPQVAELTELLRFNGLLDADDAYTDPVALLTLGADDLPVPLELYPARRLILDALRDQIEAARGELLTFGADDFTDVADDAQARRVVDLLEGSITEDGRIREDSRDLFGDTEGYLDLGAGFTDADGVVVYERIGAIVRAQAPYRLDMAAVADLGFDEQEQGQLVALLADAGDLDPALGVPRDMLHYFATVTNALDFALPGAEDYSKDVFFLLHAVARQTTDAMTEIANRVAALAERQQTAVLAVLQDAFGVPSDVVAAICDAITPDVLDLLVPPALADDLSALPGDPLLRRSYRRIRRFARLAAKLGLDAAGVRVAFHDQDLAGRFPEPLALPPGVEGIDALLTGWDDKIYLFRGASYWVYSATTYALADSLPKPLTDLSPHFSGLAGMDAAFTLPDGAEWLVGRGVDGRSHAFVRTPGGLRWGPKEQVWGKVRSTFDNPGKIDGAFVDADGRTYLFCGDQYVRYSGSDFSVADEGYPRAVADWWTREGNDTPLPAGFERNVDAAFHGLDGRTHVFSGDRWFDGTVERPLADRWGRPRNAFEGAARLDAAYADAEGYLLFSGDQVARMTDSPENDGVRVADGNPVRIEDWRPDVPAGFESGLDAAFRDAGGTIHLFKDGRTVALGPAGSGEVTRTARRWGVLAPVLPSGTVDAAFVGRDGRTYLFSGDRYVRYSSADYSVVDLGYPRGTAGDWGGLDRVDAAFVLDGVTHLFGPVGRILDLPAAYEADLADGRLSTALRRRLREHGVTVPDDAPVTGTSPEWQVVAEGPITLTIRRAGDRIKVLGDDTVFYVRYSTRDYTVPDAGYPRPQAENWWNLPVTLAADPAFATIDAVFTGRDDRTYLFSGSRFVVFDARHRWWSEPARLREQWDSIPFDRVDAAFVGRDGKTYVFNGDQYVRYSGTDYTQVDDRFPARVGAFWGNVANAIARTGQVDATLVLDVVETVDGAQVPHTYTYLFSGDQYVRYADGDYSAVQNGYPRPLSALRTEPRMAALSAEFDGVDAAFADHRNVYLFRGGQWHVVSDTLYRAYPDLDLAAVTCAFVENGAVLAQRDTGWARRAALEGPVVEETAVEEAVRPLTLRAVREDYRTGLDAVLTGADGATYLFKGANCYNAQLGKDYPAAEEWGRPRNTIYQDNAVDAAFVGRDGKTYLFRGDQFVTYTGTLDTTDGEPRPIADHWGGLTSVTLAYVRDGVTYLFEHPDADGVMRHLVYSGEYGPYADPDPGYPALADATFWKAPDGFPVPSAVLFEGDTMILLNGERCVQLSETGQWSYPRPIERVWRGFGRDLPPGDVLRAAFTAPDGATYFFFTDHYARYANRAFDPPAPIRQRWGRSVNPFLPDDGSRGVDAAIVFGDDTTYLFSSTQYVRYTGPDYQYADPGYPKPIAGNLRAEAAFAALPETFEDAVADRGSGPVVQAAVANGRTAYLVVGGVLHVVSRALEQTYDLALLGRARNAIQDRRRVDAALVRDDHTYLFSGDQYVRYTGSAYDHPDEGYPRSIGGDWGTLPEAFEDGLDAAFRAQDGTLYLFKGTLFHDGTTTRAIIGQWGRIRNEFAAAPVIDAAFVSPDGDLYAFRGDQYVKYRPGALDLAEEGYPRTIRDDWGALPAEFEAGICGAFVVEGRTYLARCDRYVRYSGAYDDVDRTFPQLFRHRWSGLADYRLTDVHTITGFASLARTHPGLAELLDAGGPDPFAGLAALFGWPIEEIRWLRRNAGLISAFPAEEDRFEIEFLLALVEVFRLAGRAGTGPSDLYTRVVAGAAPADALALLLERRHAPQEWEALSAVVQGELNVLKRDALLPAALRLNPDLADVRALYEHVLADVEMGPEGMTSPVREAIAATQLYIHRYLLDLEDPGAAEADVREKIKSWWAWLKNYRIWEANRKVFLYPENYIRPELRDTKTPAFRELENDLLQGEITADSVQRAYKRYLDEYTEVSRLAIAGAYVYRADHDDEGTRRLVLFGRTRTEPRRHYYRSAEFRDGARLSATWEPWVKVDIQIDADRVDPVHAFGRVFVFWSVVETVAPDATGATTIVTKQSGDQQSVAAPPPKHRVRVYYSFYNLNKEWVPAQELPPGALEDGQISDVHLFVQASATLPGGDPGVHDSIVVSRTYTVARPAGPVTVTTAHALTPELYAVPVDAAAEPARLVELSRIFDEPDGAPVDPAGVVRFNSPAGSQDGPWFSVDHKGGSFLCRPIIVDPGAGPVLTDLKDNGVRLPAWAEIDAAVELPGGTRLFFKRNAAGGGEFLEVKTRGKLRTGNDVTARTWGVVGNSLTTTGAVDGVIVRGDLTYVFSGPQYYCFRGTPFGPLQPEYPKPLRDNPDGFPRWDRVDLAFNSGTGAECFALSDGTYHESAPSGLPRKLRDGWNRTLPDAVFVRDGRTFVVTGGQYVRYGGDRIDRNGRPDRPDRLDRPDPGYPKALTDGGDDHLPAWQRLDAAFAYGDSWYYFDNGAGTYLVDGPGGRSTGQNRDLGGIPTRINTTGLVDAAYRAGGKVYLTSGLEYMRYSLVDDDTVARTADPGYPRALPQRVQGVFRRGDRRYVFGDGKYAVLADGKELGDLTPGAFHDIAGNWHSLPTGFATGFTGMLDADSQLYLFVGSQYASYPKDTVVPRPYEYAELPHEIIRLTSSSAFELNRRLLVGGVPALLAPQAQETDELPAFSKAASGPTTIKVRPEVAGMPASSHLDFSSANGRYYWEIFFHAPMLIAQALATAQRFEDARQWYEYVFDPTEQERYWRFLPFLAVDVRALVAACRADLDALADPGVSAALRQILIDVEAVAPAFEQARTLTTQEGVFLDGLAADVLTPVDTALGLLTGNATAAALREKVAMLARLRAQYNLMGDHGALLKAYQDDPFDPHTIAELRPAAYRRAVVMAYVDNLLDWGDMLFRQYTMESIDEARMLYVLAYDLLGRRPEGVGPRALSPTLTYDDLRSAEWTPDAAAERITAGGRMLDGLGAIHTSVAHPYYFIPGNPVLGDYWTRVEDRLRKIRASLDILGVSRPLPLFEPPADVMALVRGAAAGLSPDQVVAGASAPVPHYRFSFVMRKAQELVDELRQFGGDLVSVLERRDGEQLNLLRARQDTAIQIMMREIKEAQVRAAAEGLAEAQVALDYANKRVTYYQDLIAAGLTPLQLAQIAAMTGASIAHLYASGLKIGAAIAFAAPQALVGPFIMGTELGGEQVGQVLDKGAEVASSIGEALSVTGELFAVRVEQERQEGDWKFQLMVSQGEVAEIQHQVASAAAQLASAQRDLELTNQEIANAQAVAEFMTGKFSNVDLYQWMSGRLATLYFQSYNMAYDMARAAERAYQYERGTDQTFVRPAYWENQRNGLMAGEALGQDLQRLATAYLAGDMRGLEITRRVSLLALDPLALLKLKSEGRCEFALTEAMYDRDFPGHYRRRIKTVSVTFENSEEIVDVNATLTQLGHRTVLTPDPAAVRYLVDGRGAAPATVRSDWRAGQQIALSDVEEGRDNNGLFELRFDDDRYLPFEGTGAVSTWRLETSGLPPADLSDVTIVVKYVADQGGAVFANAVKGMLKPYQAARYLDVAEEFPDEWSAFTEGETDELTLPLTPALFPRLTGRQLTGVAATYVASGTDQEEAGPVRLLLDGDRRTALTEGSLVRAAGMTADDITFTADGDPSTLSTIGLIFTYRAV